MSGSRAPAYRQVSPNVKLERATGHLRAVNLIEGNGQQTGTVLGFARPAHQINTEGASGLNSEDWSTKCKRIWERGEFEEYAGIGSRQW